MSSYTTTDMFGRPHVVRSNGRWGTDMDRAQVVLEADEGCRNNQTEALFVYWLMYDLDIIQAFVEPDKHDAMIAAARLLTPAKTVLNRVQDCQRTHEHLAPSPDVAERRGKGAGW